MTTTPTLRKLSTAIALAAAMAVTAGAAATLKPTKYLADTRPELKIEPSLPNEFGDWKLIPTVSGGVVNPQQNELLNILYSEIINRTYVNSKGQRVMLSIAYGKNQNDSFQVHKPEICYPAQGFQLLSNRAGELKVAGGVIPVRRLETKLGSNRYEPVTYWTTLGDKAVRSGVEKKLAEVSFAMKGFIADGLLYRVSSIDSASDQAFLVHQNFVDQMMEAVDPPSRARLAGLP
ncbi:exosortase-associated protein EpsI, B-type [Sphaerotilus mobilis]|uniref:EpsI family protein n=1 Tax=Sphaerotilus mobilis TaxID=47994 RepID=A0A4Q7LUI6_9BURK|nr:exosortase-associated protein EpsI, B-type [Sphaerotilus mobilis]RZS58201.1 EpsI family protein [Sphaerotilus mobilis]